MKTKRIAQILATGGTGWAIFFVWMALSASGLGDLIYFWMILPGCLVYAFWIARSFDARPLRRTGWLLSIGWNLLASIICSIHVPLADVRTIWSVFALTTSVLALISEQNKIAEQRPAAYRR